MGSDEIPFPDDSSVTGSSRCCSMKRQIAFTPSDSAFPLKASGRQRRHARYPGLLGAVRASRKTAHSPAADAAPRHDGRQYTPVDRDGEDELPVAVGVARDHGIPARVVDQLQLPMPVWVDELDIVFRASVASMALVVIVRKAYGRSSCNGLSESCGQSEIARRSRASTALQSTAMSYAAPIRFAPAQRNNYSSAKLILLLTRGLTLMQKTRLACLGGLRPRHAGIGTSPRTQTPAA